MDNNYSVNIEIRRCRENIRIIGSGIILFGAWTIAKTVLLLLVDTTPYEDILNQYVEEGVMEISMVEVVIISTFFIVVFSAIEMLLRLSVGMSAQALSKGKKIRHPHLYILFICLLILGELVSVIFEIYDIVSTEYSGQGTISGVIIELTSMTLAVELLVFTGRLHKLTASKEA